MSSLQPHSKLDGIESFYRIRNGGEVQEYLINHPELLAILGEAHPEIKKYFPDSTLELDIMYDMESDEDEGQLLVHICTDLDPMDAMKRLDEFDHSWWLDRISRFGSRLCISLAFTD